MGVKETESKPKSELVGWTGILLGCAGAVAYIVAGQLEVAVLSMSLIPGGVAWIGMYRGWHHLAITGLALAVFFMVLLSFTGLDADLSGRLTLLVAGIAAVPVLAILLLAFGCLLLYGLGTWALYNIRHRKR